MKKEKKEEEKPSLSPIEKGKKKERRINLLLLITIVVAIIVAVLGGVYAYFAARVSTNENAITGQTLVVDGGSLTIAATRVNLYPNPEPASDNLVPANFGVTANNKQLRK